MQLNPDPENPISATRRTVLATAVTGVGLGLAGCSTYGQTKADSPVSQTSAPQTSAPDATTPPATAESTTPPSPVASTEPPAPVVNALAKVSDIPIGGGKIFKAEKVVVTQPKAGTIKAFSSTCTHQGCQVTAVSSTIDCPCHGSKFNITDGSVASPPATEGLPAVKVKVTGDAITLA